MEGEDSPVSQAPLQTQVAPVAWRAPLRQVTNTKGQPPKQMSEGQANALMGLLLEGKPNVMRDAPQPRHIPQQASDGLLPKVVVRNTSRNPPTKTTPEVTPVQMRHASKEASAKSIASTRESGKSLRGSTVRTLDSQSRDLAGLGAAPDTTARDGATQTSTPIRKTTVVPQLPDLAKTHFHTWRQEAMAGRYVRRRAGRIPKDQAELLDTKDCWQPAAPGHDTRPASVPISLLQQLSARADAAANKDLYDQERSSPRLEEAPLDIPAPSLPTGTKTLHISQLGSSQELPSSQWSSSPEREPPHARLPPDSSPTEGPMNAPLHILPKATSLINSTDVTLSPPSCEKAVQVKQTPYPGEAKPPSAAVHPSSTYVPSTFPSKKRGPSDTVLPVPPKRARNVSSSAEEITTYSQIAREKLQYRRSVLKPLSKNKSSVEPWFDQTAQVTQTERDSREASVELGTPNIDRRRSVSVEEVDIAPRLTTKTKHRRPSTSRFGATTRTVPDKEAALTPKLVSKTKTRPSASPFAQAIRRQGSWQQGQTPFKRFVEAFNSLPRKSVREQAVNVFTWRSERA